MASMASTVVLQALTNACSQDPTLLKRAEDELKSWETQPGFYTTLMVCLASTDTGPYSNTRACMKPSYQCITVHVVEDEVKMLFFCLFSLR